MQTFKIGQVVRVYDNTPEPPKHHRKKLREWHRKNFTGYIHEETIDGTGNVAVAKHMGALGGCTAVVNVSYINPDRITVVPEQEQ